MRGVMNRLSLFFLIALMTITVGCGGTAAKSDYDGRTDNAWMVTLVQSGGIAGVMKTLSVDSAGVMDIREGRDGVATRKILSIAVVNQLDSLISDTGSQKNSAQTGSVNRNCRDCMQFQLTIQGIGKEVRHTVDSSGLAGSPYYFLITRLIQLAK